MLFAATLLLIAGYTLLYAGTKGIWWAQPWKLLTLTSPSAAVPTTENVDVAGPFGAYAPLFPV